MSFAETLDTWRDRSNLGTLESRNNFIDLLNGTAKLIQLLERTVHFTHMGLEPTVIALLALIPNKDNLHEELKHIIMGLPYEFFWKALEMMYVPKRRRGLIVGCWRRCLCSDRMPVALAA